MVGLRILLFGVSLILFSPFPVAGDSLPQTIGPLKLEKFQSGDEARREINRLHGKNIDFQDGYIGNYKGDDGSATLWVSEYGSEGDAFTAIHNMAQRLETSKEGVFWHFREISIEGAPVYFVVGMGQAHYFFQKGAKAIWLAVDPSLAKVAIRDVFTKIP